ncbi:MAG: hypothetical protein C0467_12660 [Planctomycetaceae bacterium]|nr:hypothetical protein [Planctomycetaceae bacterium]
MLATDRAPSFEFDTLKDLVEYLRGLAQGSNDDEIKEYAEQVQREGLAVERALTRWGGKKEVTLSSAVGKEIEAVKRGDKLKT